MREEAEVELTKRLELQVREVREEEEQEPKILPMERLELLILAVEVEQVDKEMLRMEMEELVGAE